MTETRQDLEREITRLHYALRDALAERDSLREALRRISDGPWPPEIDSAEEQTRFDERIARAALEGE